MAAPFLRIQRMDRWYASALPVHIYVDGQRRAEMRPPAPGGAVDVRLPHEGSYEIQFEIDGCRSAVYQTPLLREDQYQTLEIELPEKELFSWLFRRNCFGRFVPRSPAVANT